MFDFSKTTLEHLIIHKVGNDFDDSTIFLSEKELRIDDKDLKKLLVTFFLSSFKPGAFYEFEMVDIDANKMFKFVSEIFANQLMFREQSNNIAQHLQESSKHPNIKQGELYIALFDNCKIGNQTTQCLGIFKSESKDTFVKVYQNENQLIPNCDEGISIKKMEKGCLIFNTDKDTGYKIVISDKINKTLDCEYWKTEFLKIVQISDNYYQTENIMQICKQFADEILTETSNVDKAQQVAYLQRSSDYFNAISTFDNEEFTKKVIGQPEVITAFNDYKNQYSDNYSIELLENFPVSKPAVAKSKKYFKPVIKLDKNFHLYVHGNPDLIEKGHDKNKNMNYYKLYFNEEN